MVYANQDGYYQMINQSTSKDGCGIFIEFMLEKMLQTLKKNRGDVGVKIQKHIRSSPGCRANSIEEALGVTLRIVERHIRLLREQKRIEFRGAPKNGGYFAVS